MRAAAAEAMVASIEERNMLRRISLKWLFVVVWLIVFTADYAVRFCLTMRYGDQYKTDWQFTAIVATAVAGLVVMFVKDLQDRPTPE
jgi:hypothetical protein